MQVKKKFYFNAQQNSQALLGAANVNVESLVKSTGENDRENFETINRYIIHKQNNFRIILDFKESMNRNGIEIRYDLTWDDPYETATKNF